MKTQFATLALIASILTGCTSTAIAPPIVHVEGSAIQVTRDGGILGSACTIDALVDGKKVASLGVGESVTVQVEPGKHLVGMSTAQNGVACDFIPLVQFETTIGQDHVQTFRISGTYMGQWSIAPTSL